MSKTKAAWRSFWVLAARAGGGMRMLTIDIGGEKMLPVFSFEGEGESYLRSEELSADWWPRETSAGELVSLLLGLCAGVDKVALDPLPGLREKEVTGLLSMGRRDFVHHLIGEVGAVDSGRSLWLQAGRVAAPIVLHSPSSKEVGR